jgi:hypothetical protein
MPAAQTQSTADDDEPRVRRARGVRRARRDAGFGQGTIATAEPNAVPSAGCTAMCR